jgi:hypothetical protein
MLDNPYIMSHIKDTLAEHTKEGGDCPSDAIRGEDPYNADLYDVALFFAKAWSFGVLYSLLVYTGNYPCDWRSGKFYTDIEDTAIVESVMQEVEPTFGNMHLPVGLGNKEILWSRKGSNEFLSFNLLPKGTRSLVRMMHYLIPPDFKQFYPYIILGNPEQDLSPVAIEHLVDLINEASKRSQVILTTQSEYLLNNLHISNVVRVEKGANGEAVFQNT